MAAQSLAAIRAGGEEEATRRLEQLRREEEEAHKLADDLKRRREEAETEVQNTRKQRRFCEDCPFCLEPLSNYLIMELSCNHVVHVKCLRQMAATVHGTISDARRNHAPINVAPLVRCPTCVKPIVTDTFDLLPHCVHSDYMVLERLTKNALIRTAAESTMKPAVQTLLQQTGMSATKPITARTNIVTINQMLCASIDMPAHHFVHCSECSKVYFTEIAAQCGTIEQAIAAFQCVPCVRRIEHERQQQERERERRERDRRLCEQRERERRERTAPQPEQDVSHFPTADFIPHAWSMLPPAVADLTTPMTCDNCEQIIWRESGARGRCSHETCPGCNYEFCMVCGGAFNTFLSVDHRVEAVRTAPYCAPPRREILNRMGHPYRFGRCLCGERMHLERRRLSETRRVDVTAPMLNLSPNPENIVGYGFMKLTRPHVHGRGPRTNDA